MKYKDTKDPTYYILKDIANSLSYGNVKPSKRIQVVMPKVVVDELDSEFPNVERSKLLTQLAVEALLSKKRYAKDETLGDLEQEEQHDLDRMLEYLENEEENERI